jgi:ribonuclease Z
MEPFRIHILGCGSALPTLKHLASSQVVEVRGKYSHVDCGEGTQIQRDARAWPHLIQAVFISTCLVTIASVSSHDLYLGCWDARHT